MVFWTTLSEALKQKGFSDQEIKNLQVLFGNLDATALLNTPPEDLLSAMPGRTPREKQANIETLRTTIRGVQAALARDDSAPDDFTVYGHVSDANNRPVSNATVKAFHRGIGREVTLGRATTDTAGKYAMTIPARALAGAGQTMPHLLLRVATPRGTQIGASDLVLNARSGQTIDVSVTHPDELPLSTYEALTARIFPLLRGQQLAELADHDVSVLAAETQTDRTSVEVLRQSTNLARRLAMPAEPLYGLASQGITLDAETLLNGNDADVLTALLEAGHRNVISPVTNTSARHFLKSLEALRLESGTRVHYNLSVQLRDATTAIPLAGCTVRIVDPSAPDVIRELDMVSSDVTGTVNITYTASPDASSARTFRLLILDRDGKEIHGIDIQTTPGRKELGHPIDVPSPSDLRHSPAVTDAAATLQISLAPELAAALDRHNIKTLDDIRRAGSLERLADPAIPSDSPAVTRLSALAELSLVSDDMAQNTRLVDSGYGSLSTIAATSRAAFVAATKADLPQEQAEQIYAAASGLTGYISNVAMGMRAYTKTAQASWPDDKGKLPPIEDETASQCNCTACNNAVGPSAYLADLLDYALKYVKRDPSGQAIDLTYLERELHTPFAGLPTNCAASEQRIKQIRLLIEVLRSATNNLPTGFVAGYLASFERDYLDAAYVTLLAEMGTSYIELQTARGASQAERESTARRLGFQLADGAGIDRLNSLTLHPRIGTTPSQRTEAMLEQLFGLPSTIRPATLTNADPGQTPALVSWRLAYLRLLWGHEDWQLEQSHWNGPIIEPDLIGPDDFRNLATAANSPFDLWIKRRGQVDTALNVLHNHVPDIQAMLAEVYGSPQPDFAHLSTQMKANPQPENMAGTIFQKTGMDLDAFRRFLELQQTLAAGGGSHDDEWNELAAILTQVVKVRDPAFYAAWIAKESAEGIYFDSQTFWQSTYEPTTGTWPPKSFQNLILIDPDNVSLADLREVDVGGIPGRQLWQQRGDALSLLKNQLAELSANEDIIGMVKLAANLPDTSTNISVELEQIAASLAADIGDTVSATTLQGKYRLTIPEFLQLWEIHTRLTGTSTTLSPALTADDWEQAFQVLKRAYKRQQGWQQAEGNIKYWTVLRMSLGPWRATTDQRRLWHHALATAMRQPIIDPRLLDDRDFASTLEVNAAWLVFQARSQWVDALSNQIRNRLQAASNPSAWLRQELDLLGLSLAELAQLSQDGTSLPIASRLAQIGLSRKAFNRLYSVHRLLQSGHSLGSSEVEEVSAILLQVATQRQFALWNREEAAQQIILSPDQFRPRPKDQLFSTPTWSGTSSARRAWDQRLKARIDQEKSVQQAQAASIAAAEDAALPILRSGLVYAAYMQSHPVLPNLITTEHAPDNNQQIRFRWVTSHYLIDAEMGPCRETTRIQQAIETLQGLIWAIHTGLVAKSGRQLRLDSDHFDEEWKWMGSYAAWRAAMMAFIYPENILLPSLRKRQTPGFRLLSEQLRQAGQVTPAVADTIAKTYSEDWLDVLDMQVEATLSVQQDFNLPEQVYFFGRGGETKRLYWSSMQAGSPPEHWATLPNMEDIVATEIIGASRYQQPSGKDALYLFVKGHKGGNPQLFLRALELDQQGTAGVAWSGTEAQALSIDRGPGWKALLALKTAVNAPPGLLIWGGGKAVEFKQLNDEASDWAAAGHRPDTDFAIFQDDNDDEMEMADLVPLAIVQQRLYPYNVGISRFFILAFNPEAQVTKRLLALEVIDSNTGYRGIQQGAWSMQQPADWRGAHFWSAAGQRRLIAFRRIGGTIAYTSIALALAGSSAVESTVGGTFANPWLSNSVDWARAAEVYGSIGHAYLAYQQPVQSQQFPNIPYRRARLVHSIVPNQQGRPEVEGIHTPLAQLVPLSALDLPTPVTLDRNRDHLQRSRIRLATDLNAPEQNDIFMWRIFYGFTSARNRDYIQEAFYYVPMTIAAKLQQGGHFLAALDWYRKVFDYSKRYRSDRFAYPPLATEGTPGAPDFERITNWLLDPLDVHAIAVTRPFTDTRFVLLAVIRCLLEYGDAEFSQDTSESLARARELYALAINLLDDDVFAVQTNSCDELIGELIITVGEDRLNPAWAELIEAIAGLGYRDLITQSNTGIKRVMSSDRTAPNKLREARSLYQNLNRVAIQRRQHSLGEALKRSATVVHDRQRLLLANDAVAKHTGYLGGSHAYGRLGQRGTGNLVQLGRIIPAPRLIFCILPNPVLSTLRFHAELNLYKLRTCRNIAGMERELEPYSAPTGVASGLPTIGTGGQINLPGAFSIRPTQYRYRVLVERAKQMVGIAQQMEATFLSFIEKKDAERYHMLKARQDARLTRAGVRLQDLRVEESEHGVALAELQRQRASIQLEHFDQLIVTGLLEQEWWASAFLWINATLQFSVGTIATGGAIAAGLVAGGVLGSKSGPGAIVTALAGGGGAAALSMSLSQTAYSSITGGIATTSSALSMLASFERRRQEWEFQKSLSVQDGRIGTQQIALAKDRVRITGQEREIANMQANHADDVIEFLSTKFTSAELYDWMSSVMESVYRYFLQQSTGIARLAENQLGFERQEMPPAFIQADYWDAPRDGSSTTQHNGNMTDRRGLTGSARLLQDVHRLDHHAFETDRRKLQLTKTLSLARLDPFAFQQFRETGVLVFATPMRLFDHDFPGHYLRLIKAVSTSVIALIPPMDGIKATLATTGISRVVIGGDLFQTTVVNRGPESVALSSPQNATGLFEFDSQGQGEMTLPFEGLGVDTIWEFRLPKPANSIEYTTIADVLITIEYTALDSPIYRKQVIEQLDNTVSADRPFSFRHQFADAWYDLHHPDLVQAPQKPMEVSFASRREDFPPNVTDLTIQHVTLYIARKSGTTVEFDIDLTFIPLGSTGDIGGTATTVDGAAGTRQGNAGAWTAIIGKSPIGKWTLAFEDTEEIKELFANNQIEDILFVITFGGETPPWPH